MRQLKTILDLTAIQQLGSKNSA